MGQCPECGRPLSGQAVGGLCPRCIARQYFEGSSDDRPGVKVLAVEPGAPDAPSAGLSASAARWIPVPEVRSAHLRWLGQIDQGGMGTVHEAQDLNLGRKVALKRMRPVPANREAAATARFVAEAQIGGQLEHPGIVPVYELGLDAEGRVFYTMRRLEGVTLARVLERLRDGDSRFLERFPLAALLTLFLKVCDAVAYAHSRQVIHRDLKPENVMVGTFGEVSVLDWGLAKLAAAEEEGLVPEPTAGSGPAQSVARPEILRTLDRVAMGTPGFMAPEQARGQTRQCDERTDIYGLGAILYSILTLEPPVPGDDAAAVIEKTRRGEIRPPVAWNRERDTRDRASTRPVLPHCPERQIPRSLSAVAMKALALEPKDRYAKVEDLKADLEAYLGGFATTAELPGLVTLVRLWIRRHRREFVVVCLFLGLVLGFSAVIARMAWALWGTAPTFHDKAVTLLEDGRFAEALAPIAYAIRLDPDNPRYRLTEGHLHQALFEFDQAARAYAEALRLDPRSGPARENLELSRLLADANRGRPEVSSASVTELHTALLRQERHAEARAVLRALLARDQAARERTYRVWRARLDRAGIGGQLVIREDGHVSLGQLASGVSDISVLEGLPLDELSLQLTRVTDLRPLAGLPIQRLTLADNPDLRDLTPLRGLPLRHLVADNTGVAGLAPLAGLPLETLSLTRCAEVNDLTPLRGMRLKWLSLFSTRVADLRPLTGMPIEYLLLNSTPVADLSPLRGSPIQHLVLEDCRSLTNWAVLRGLPLRALFFSHHRRLEDLEFLRGHRLTHLDVTDTDVTDLEPLRGMPLEHFYANNTPVKNIDALRGMSLVHLDLSTTDVTDLRPLAAMTVQHLYLVNAPIRDLSPLEGAPVETLLLHGCTELRDLSPLATLPKLTRLTLPTHIADLDFLRGKPGLEQIGHAELMPADRFWRAYDRARQP